MNKAHIIKDFRERFGQGVFIHTKNDITLDKKQLFNFLLEAMEKMYEQGFEDASKHKRIAQQMYLDEVEKNEKLLKDIKDKRREEE